MSSLELCFIEDMSRPFRNLLILWEKCSAEFIWTSIGVVPLRVSAMQAITLWIDARNRNKVHHVLAETPNYPVWHFQRHVPNLLKYADNR